MSGIVGIVHFGGAPVDRHQLGQMTGFMAFRGPDAQEIWVEGNAGFGHTLLRTTDESERERQPFSLDGRVWIVADARIDARHELLPRLRAQGHENLSPDATDVELILRAYQAWGEDCVEHLLGDFAFAIWDGPRRQLFCARDHLGVKPFFYAHLGHTLIFSNTLDCIRQHPAVSGRLNDLAIADFLLFDLNQDMATTSFADIQRIPPAHRGTWSAGSQEIGRYWTLPVDEPINFRQADDYVDRFRELLEQAVDDRLRTKTIGICMSGGLDSPTLAATACRILRGRTTKADPSTSGVRAVTTVIDGFDGDERYYAGLVGKHLGIPVHFRDRSGKFIDPGWEDLPIHTREPNPAPTNLNWDREEQRVMAAYSRVWFYGEGPDNALRHEWENYMALLFRRRQFVQLAKRLGEMVTRSRRIPFLSRIAGSLSAGKASKGECFPEWLQPDLVLRLKLRERWEEVQRAAATPSPHPWRPQAYRSFQQPIWESLFSESDAEAMGMATEFRHPFVDLRLLRFMLAVPVPWCREKYLLRRAMKNELPSQVLRRPKTPLQGDPLWESARTLGHTPLKPAAGLERFVDYVRLPDEMDRDVIAFWMNLRPRALNYWLRNLRTAALDWNSQRFENERVAGWDRNRNIA